MTPAARVQAAIEILDEILTGAPVEKALTGWARRSRFAGSKDRAAVRDHVFDALRCQRSFAALGSSHSGRGLMIGAIRAQGGDTAAIFTGDRHAPDPVQPSETSRAFRSDAERFDIPEWLWPRFSASLGSETPAVAEALQSRAPVHLRVNLLKADAASAIAALQADGVIAQPHAFCTTALEVTEGARKIAQGRAYQDGLVELQDAASQAVVSALELQPGMRVLDYCAGGGGKSLALAAFKGVEVFAHDVNAARMRDLPARAKRAGARVKILTSKDLDAQKPFDIVLADAPCSGSGSWRRAPAGKWALTEERLQDLTQIQSGILQNTTALVRKGGVFAYATCSVLTDENGSIVDSFLARNPEWAETFRKSWQVAHGSDGFFTAHLTR
ncbi:MULTISPECIES: RsmB/NOP family class I SAM-dependent RNA methyltransferase [unclassified Ruegeria]|uniref:RsmB/NOP family class I SAM-dependent RNA methyltransferase n=1 Tax=unclassified Ruegeria TaxID=2625375 RepID=UPI001491AB3A|nr:MULTISPECIES: RsmB/NOP family class I SAM-dependent RNA methyltransferase [unclassified Ruegeria]NOD75370.1 RsmB/NOP family class I SAM-dependent RNA methyltransferase [Ruegeria sp. HKCCD4332]NOD87331.1 RsmB/NOP family class I SAM-dependent RNA methyltransferase [Ruegeria sp. HKCCD4318]NOE12886.1 RsmB/NOP family class I SAM-dependent RNA methyltransferase [Ruegeria sp. HKCCD4318-2]NOG08947.1 RsmB/NOP family class I SAM-dependent RNA methyltransferase [Ruegeria sp. HKCCD4315]